MPVCFCIHGSNLYDICSVHSTCPATTQHSMYLLCFILQGLFSSLYGGLGSGLGALLGGFLMEALGGQGLFFVCSLVVLAGWLMGFAAEMLLTRTNSKEAAYEDCQQ